MAESLVQRIAAAIQHGDPATYLLPTDGIEPWAREVEIEPHQRSEIIATRCGPSRTRPDPIVLKINIDRQTGDRVLDLSTLTYIERNRLVRLDHG